MNDVHGHITMYIAHSHTTLKTTTDACTYQLMNLLDVSGKCRESKIVFCNVLIFSTTCVKKHVRLKMGTGL